MAETKPPTQLGPYVVQRELGRGGMGVVYLASDPRLDRSVAIKVLPDVVADEPDRLARLSREAKALATLNHPNVASIYGLEDQPQPAGHSRSVLVLEYVPGPTLSERLGAGPLPIDEALRIMAQVAGGLEAAHERGLIHRDLKPDNIKITPDGQAKILDFGLAKAESPFGSAGASTVAATLAVGTPAPVVTRRGVVMGTPGYMSPEQCRGKPLDKRTDIWSFGVVLYECLAGRQPFRGETLSDAIAAVLEREPDFALLPARTPPRVRELLMRCLEKETSRRLRDVGDAKIELDQALVRREWSSTQALDLSLLPRGRRRVAPWGLALTGIVVGLGLGVLLGRSAATAPSASVASAAPAYRLNLLLDDPPIALPSLAIAPGGRWIAYPATVRRGDETKTVLAWRRLDGSASGVVPDLQGVQSLAFAPDGKALAVSAGEGSTLQVYRLAIKDDQPTGSKVLIISDAQRFAQLAWESPDSLLVLNPMTRAIQRVPGAGGEAQTVWSDSGGAYARLNQLEVVPGAQWALVTGTITEGGTTYRSHILRVSLKDGTSQRLVENASQARFLEPGHLLYVQEGALMARAFDRVTAALAGTPAPLNLGVISPRATISVSREGTLVLPPPLLADINRRLRLIDSAGKVMDLDAKDRPIGPVVSPSPDGQRVALAVYEADPYVTTGLQVLDLTRKTVWSIATGTAAGITGAVWAQGGERLLWGRYEAGKGTTILSAQADGGGTPRQVGASAQRLVPVALTPDGAALLLLTQEQGGQRQAPQIMDLASGQVRPLPQAVPGARDLAISPDGELLAYVAPPTRGSERAELFVERFDPAAPAGGDRPRVQVSVDGIVGPPRFSADSKELRFITAQRRLVSASIVREPRLSVAPQLTPLGELDPAASPATWTARTSGLAIGGWGPAGLVVAMTPADDLRRQIVTVVTGAGEVAAKAVGR